MGAHKHIGRKPAANPGARTCLKWVGSSPILQRLVRSYPERAVIHLPCPQPFHDASLSLPSRCTSQKPPHITSSSAFANTLPTGRLCRRFCIFRFDKLPRLGREESQHYALGRSCCRRLQGINSHVVRGPVLNLESWLTPSDFIYRLLDGLPERICPCCPSNTISLSTTVSIATMETANLSTYHIDFPRFSRIASFHLRISSGHGKTLSLICLPHELMNDPGKYLCRVAHRWFMDSNPLPATSVGVDFTVIGVLGPDYSTYSRISKAIRKVAQFEDLSTALTSAKENWTAPSHVEVRNQSRIPPESKPRMAVHRQRCPRVRSLGRLYPRRYQHNERITTHFRPPPSQPSPLPAPLPSSPSTSPLPLATDRQLTPPSSLPQAPLSSRPSPANSGHLQPFPMPSPPATFLPALASVTPQPLVPAHASTQIPRLIDPGKRHKIETPGQNRKRVRTDSPMKKEPASLFRTPSRIPIHVRGTSPAILASNSYNASANVGSLSNTPSPRVSHSHFLLNFRSQWFQEAEGEGTVQSGRSGEFAPTQRPPLPVQPVSPYRSDDSDVEIFRLQWLHEIDKKLSANSSLCSRSDAFEAPSAPPPPAQSPVEPSPSHFPDKITPTPSIPNPGNLLSCAPPFPSSFPFGEIVAIKLSFHQLTCIFLLARQKCRNTVNFYQHLTMTEIPGEANVYYLWFYGTRLHGVRLRLVECEAPARSFLKMCSYGCRSYCHLPNKIAVVRHQKPQQTPGSNGCPNLPGLLICPTREDFCRKKDLAALGGLEICYRENKNDSYDPAKTQLLTMGQSFLDFALRNLKMEDDEAMRIWREIEAGR